MDAPAIRWNRYEYDTFASDRHQLIEHLDLREATLVGFSMGGGEVVRYLSRFGSGRMDRAVLVSAVTPYLTKTNDNPDGADPRYSRTWKRASGRTVPPS